MKTAHRDKRIKKSAEEQEAPVAGPSALPKGSADHDAEEHATPGGDSSASPSILAHQTDILNEEQVATFNAQMAEFGLTINQNGTVDGEPHEIDATLEAMVISDNAEILDIFSLAWPNDSPIPGQGGTTLLHLAADMGNERFTKQLLNKRIDVDVPDENNFTPLHYAVSQGCELTTVLLLDRGASTSVKGINHKAGQTPLHCATLAGMEVCARKLLEAGADPNAVDGEGRTPMHLAARKNSSPWFHHLLLRHGASLSIMDGKGKRPVDYAKKEALLFLKLKMKQKADEIDE